MQPPESLQPLSQSERFLLAKRALVVLPIGVGIGAVAAWMLTGPGSGFSLGIRAFFGLFFGGLLLFILGVHIGSAFEIQKRVVTGLVTGKRVRASGSTGANSRPSSTFYVSIDGDERMVEQWVYQQVHTGQTVSLSYTARLRNLFAVKVISEPAGVETRLPAADGLHRPGRASPPVRPAPLTADDRKVLRAALLRALIFRGVGGAILAAVVFVVAVIGWVVALDSLPALSQFDWLALTLGAPGLAALPMILLNRQTYRLIRDLSGGQRCVGAEQVLDVVRSNTHLASSTAIVTGPGLGGNHVWILTDKRWTQLPDALAGDVFGGSTLMVATGPRSDVILDIQVA